MSGTPLDLTPLISGTYTFNGAGAGNVAAGHTLADVIQTFHDIRNNGAASLFNDTIEDGGGIDWLVGVGNGQVYGDFWQPTDPSGNAQHIVAWFDLRNHQSGSQHA